jgi:hypothetical protein
MNTPPEEDNSELRELAQLLSERARLVFEDLVTKREHIRTPKDMPDAPSEWETTGCYYGRPPVRVRPLYEGRDNMDTIATDASEAGVCKKYYSTYKQSRQTGGLMAFWCTHLICLGFHKMPKSEGRNDVFSALYTYFEKAPDTVVYDFACQLGAYSMSREPEFFKNTCFAIDELHAKGHVGCSQASFMSNYMQVRPTIMNINTSAAECSNSGLNRIRKSVSYMTQNHAIRLTYIYLCVWNRQRERQFQGKMNNEMARLEGMWKR